MNDRFGVSARTITMASRFKSRSQRFVIVDLAVESYPDAPIFVGHGIAARRREVDNSKPPVAKPDCSIVAHVDARVVGSAMSHRVAHAHDERLGDSRSTHAVFIDSADAAHKTEVRSQKSEIRSRKFASMPAT